jgi:hypothetical protein
MIVPDPVTKVRVHFADDSAPEHCVSFVLSYMGLSGMS